MLRLQLYCPVSVRSFFSMASSWGCGDEAPAQANIITSPLFRMLLAGERGGMLFGSMWLAQGAMRRPSRLAHTYACQFRSSQPVAGKLCQKPSILRQNLRPFF